MSNLWKNSLKNLITSPEELWSLLQLPEKYLADARIVCEKFPLRVTREFVSRMKIGDLSDPLLNQVLPVKQELELHPSFSLDPLGEQEKTPTTGLLHKYNGRVLLIFTGSCAIHCRYCFRREFPYSSQRLGSQNWSKVLHYIENDPSIEEVILSGGDPLIATDELIKQFILLLEKIPHIKRLRIHSRLPIVLPTRITKNLVEILTSTRLKPIMVIHCNHVNEIDLEVAHAVKYMIEKNILLLNQAVLLKGINDNAFTLKELAEKLFEMNVQFYYLHLLDHVQGTAHFDNSTQHTKTIFNQLQASLPGYMVPKLVREIPNEASKVVFATN